jgi:hypothetical protein
VSIVGLGAASADCVDEVVFVAFLLLAVSGEGAAAAAGADFVLEALFEGGEKGSGVDSVGADCALFSAAWENFGGGGGGGGGVGVKDELAR